MSRRIRTRLPTCLSWALQFRLALNDPGIGRLFAVKCLGLAMHNRTGFLDDDLGDEGLRAVFASPSNYRTHVAPIFDLVVPGSVGSASRPYRRVGLASRSLRYDWNPKSTTKSYHGR